MGDLRGEEGLPMGRSPRGTLGDHSMGCEWCDGWERGWTRLCLMGSSVVGSVVGHDSLRGLFQL